MSKEILSREQLRSDGGLKWTYFADDVLPAWVAEMDFGLAPPIASALHDAVDKGLTGYPFPEAEEATARAATEFWDERFGWSVDSSWVFPAPDVIEGARRAIVHLTHPGSPVVLHSPVYFPFYSMVERSGRELIEVRCERDSDGRYTLNLAGIDRALDDGAGSVVLCNPWNPTGRVFDPVELAELIEVVARHDARIIADEIHSPITYEGFSHTPVATLDPERSVTIASASKAWNLPGLKCAQVVLTSERDRQTWSEYFTPDKVGVGTFGLIANEAAYRSGREWFDDVLDQLVANRSLLTELISQHLPRAGYHPPDGTYLAWLDMRAYGLEDPTSYCLEEARVAVTGGEPFGSGADQFVRFNFACSGEMLVEMVERLGSALPRI
ncbi:MAG: aminotransferase class I/II-fold pyridoxal phosphate-dependent enzyme [Acidimicrobiia bacterium]|jgi:cystathionine beta-lyase